MIPRDFRRRPLLGAPLALMGAVVAGCTPPPPPQPPPQQEPQQPLPMLGSLAAFGTVQAIDAAARQVVLRSASGGLLEVTIGPEFRGMGQLRPGTRVLVEYDARGVARLGFPPRAAGAGRGGRIRGTLQEVERGGRHLIIAAADGTVETVALPDPSMMAFATRLRAGDEVVVTILPARR